MSSHSNRRRFFSQVGTAAAGGFLSSKVYLALDKGGVLARAEPTANKFILYIHCGSWDGIAAGLLQPNSTGGWPLGVFENGEQTLAPNPLINQISAHEKMFFHRYNKVLGEVIGDLFHFTLNPRSLDHNVAEVLQKTGHESLHPSWTAGFAQTVRKPDSGPAIISGTGGILNSFTPNVALINSATLGGYRESLRDPVGSGHSASVRGKFGAVASEIYREQFGTSIVPGHFQSTFDGTHKYWSQGVPELAETGTLVRGVRDAISVERANALIDTHMGNNDAKGVKDRYSNFAVLRESLVLAGALAKSGLASAMSIDLPREDYHTGGSQVLTARSGGQLWTQLVLFWKWVIAQGLQDQILVAVSHEFSRTRFNDRVQRIPIIVNGTQQEIVCPGTDHGLTAGMYLLNGKLPGGSRYGGILESYVAAGSSGLGTAPLASLPAATSQQAVGTALMTCFPDVFRNPREPESARNLRVVFPTMEDSDVILPLLKASS